MEPVIKWSGSKRSQCVEILKYFPNEIETYYEPFCGGCSVLMGLLKSDISVKSYCCSDLNLDLINAWNMIKTKPADVILWYEKLWKELNKDDDLERKKKYFNKVRQRLNQEHNPLDFIFIMRTTTNGMPRYNRLGHFNNSFHITRNGIQPSSFKEIVKEWSYLLAVKDVKFVCCSYEEVNPNKKDFMYLDPPYANTKGMYYGGLEESEFFNWLRKQSCKYVLSYDGISGNVDNTVNVPIDIYTKHIYITNGNSSFKRVLGKSKDAQVHESLYIK